MRDVKRTIYTVWAMLILVVMLVGSPLASFGCQTIVPEQFQVPCETNFGGTAVQSNFFQPAAVAITLSVMLAFICWLRPQHQSPQQLYLLPPSPPPRFFQF